jgi:hypothetical protein
MPKTWQEKFSGAKAPHVEVLDKAFAGLDPGQRLLISSPLEIKDFIEAIPRGQIETVANMRKKLAMRHKADATCPMSTGIFVRIVSEVALESVSKSSNPEDVTPFWRLVDPQSAIAEKLSCGPSFITQMRVRETAQRT